jgi:hypothetical protein
MSCSKNDKEETIKEFVLYGYNGFAFLDSSRYIPDSTHLDIRRYFEFKRDSTIKIVKRGYLSERKYLSINQSTLNGLQDSLNKYLLNDSFQNEYLYKVPCCYDGYNYSLYFKTSKGKEILINYVPEELPDGLKIIHDYITTIIRSASHLDNKFELNNITRIDARQIFIKYPPPRLSKGIEYIAPKIIDTFIEK